MEPSTLPRQHGQRTRSQHICGKSGSLEISDMLGQSSAINLAYALNKALASGGITSHHIRWALELKQHIPEDDTSSSIYVDSVSPTPDDERIYITRVTVAQQPSLPAADLRLWNITNGSRRRITARNLVLVVMFRSAFHMCTNQHISSFLSRCCT